MAKRKGSKKGSKKTIAAISVVLILVFSGYSYEQGYFPDDFYPGEKDSIVAGAFNIQVFGTTKASKEDVMEIIPDIISQYDIIAIQEIRDSSGTAILTLMDYVQEKYPGYDYIIGERLGRTSSKEQYAYIYNTNKVSLVGEPRTYPEKPGTDPFHREPYIASFESVDGDFLATFAVIHTDPDEAEEEIAALPEVANYCMNILPEDEIVIVMGDFNADGNYFDEDGDSPFKSDGYHWLIGNELDTTTKSTDCTYDRIVVTDGYEKYYSGDSGVIRFDEQYSLTQEMTEDVSDHYPVYARFYTTSKGISGSLGSITDDVYQAGDIEITGMDVNDEWVRVSNNGEESVNITSWMVSNSAGTHVYIFPMTTLEKGETITLYSGYGSNTGNTLYWNSDEDIWNNSGDTADLLDQKGSPVDSYKI